jgi:sialic acid synthase SpsE
MVAGIREVELAIGDGDKTPTKTEMSNRLVARRSLVAAKGIVAGDALSPGMIAAKRPGTGITPMAYWDIIGTSARQSFLADDLIAL